ncbi:MAG: hypothetical protein LUE93_11120 [Bacteroides sp.]|nr:hypothetical protein [Bacteroides sp.]
MWYRIADYLADPANRQEALKIMSARAGVSPEEYAIYMEGVHFLTREEAKQVWQKGDSFQSVYGSSKIVDEFNVSNRVYNLPQNIEAYMEPSLVLELLK